MSGRHALLWRPGRRRAERESPEAWEISAAHASELIASAPRALLEGLLDTVADAVYFVDPEGRVQFINPAGLHILGYDDPAELIGRVSHPTIHYKRPDGTPFPDAECPMLRPRQTGETVRIDEDWFVRQDGTMVPVAYSSAPLQTATGRGAVVVFRDVSDRLAAEQVRRRQAVDAARVRELEASRARIVASAEAERRRLGRDLHDGAQQRLVHLMMTLSRARTANPEQVADVLEEATREARAAIAELRDLVSGIHPAILTNRGLRAAVEALTVHAPDPVTITIPAARWDAEVEAAAYFVIAESLTNVAKHTSGAHARVRVSEFEERLCIEVADDGPGGADAALGSGLRGLEDRVGVAGGKLRVRSSPEGTSVRAALPLPL